MSISEIFEMRKEGFDLYCIGAVARHNGIPLLPWFPESMRDGWREEDEFLQSAGMGEEGLSPWVA